MFDVDEVIDQDFMTYDELEGLPKGIDPDNGKVPAEPFKNLGTLSNDAIDKFAVDRQIPGYSLGATRPQKELLISDWQHKQLKG